MLPTATKVTLAIKSPVLVKNVIHLVLLAMVHHLLLVLLALIHYSYKMEFVPKLAQQVLGSTLQDRSALHATLLALLVLVQLYLNVLVVLLDIYCKGNHV